MYFFVYISCFRVFMYYFVSCRFRVHEKIRVLQFVSFLPVSKSCRVRVYNRVHELNSCRVRVYPPDTRNTKVHDTFIHDTNDLPGLNFLPILVWSLC